MCPATGSSHDVASFDLTSTHRMPTVSAAQILEDLGESRSRFIATGITTLDEAVTPALSVGEDDACTSSRGLETGQVLEIWGPPGAGKTAIALQLASSSIRSGRQVVWVDGFHPVCGQRLREVIIGRTGISTQDVEVETASLASINAFHHFTAPTLAHLLALLCKPTSASIPDGTALVVIDSFSALFNHTYPRNAEPKKNVKGPSAASRRLQSIQFIITALQKLAASRDVLIAVISQCATKMQTDRGAIITPAVSSTAFEAGLGTRLVVFRDWVGSREHSRSINVVGIQKVNGTSVPEVIGQVCPFEITGSGIRDIQEVSSQETRHAAYHKRKLDDAGFDVADSDEDVYGWLSDDEAQIPGMPTQAQGSEDLLLGEGGNRDDQSVQDDDDEESELSSPPESDSEH